MLKKPGETYYRRFIAQQLEDDNGIFVLKYTVESSKI
jgi:hypothetical protein